MISHKQANSEDARQMQVRFVVKLAYFCELIWLEARMKWVILDTLSLFSLVFLFFSGFLIAFW